MKNNNYLLQDSIISPLGFDTQENFEQLRMGSSALQFYKHTRLPEGGFLGIIENARLDAAFSEIGNISNFTKLEKMMILAVHQVVLKMKDFNPETVGLIVSTTKGNIDQLGKEGFPLDRIYLWKLAQVIADFFDIKTKPIVVSNACISGGLAVKTASDFIDSGRFNQCIVVAGDLVSDFVLSGFQSFQAISKEMCKPFSKARDGISLGEAAAALLVGPSSEHQTQIKYIDACTANDANHISGPSRTGEGLFISIDKLLKRTELNPEKIDHLSAHGTATVFNDEMEAFAFHRAGLQEVPLNSMKAYYGHTLGASALIEIIITKQAMLKNELLASHNFSELGVSKPLNIIRKNKNRELTYALKTASGFGGCNFAMLLKKEIYG